jgi:hypothetical protein
VGDDLEPKLTGGRRGVTRRTAQLAELGALVAPVLAVLDGFLINTISAGLPIRTVSACVVVDCILTHTARTWLVHVLYTNRVAFVEALASTADIVQTALRAVICSAVCVGWGVRRGAQKAELLAARTRDVQTVLGAVARHVAEGATLQNDAQRGQIQRALVEGRLTGGGLSACLVAVRSLHALQCR